MSKDQSDFSYDLNWENATYSIIDNGSIKYKRKISEMIYIFS